MRLRTLRPLREAILGYFDASPAHTAWGKYGEQIERAKQEQSRLGSEMVWRGVFTQKWGDVQEQYYRDNKEKKELTGDR